MSRVLTAKAIQSIFSPDSDSTILTLITFSGANIAQPVRICDGYVSRIEAEASGGVVYGESDDEILYGVKCGEYAPYNVSFSLTAGGSGYREGDLIAVNGTLLGGTAANTLKLTVTKIGTNGDVQGLELAASPGIKVAGAFTATNVTTTTESEGSDGTGARVTVVTKVTQVVDTFYFVPMQIVLPTDDEASLPTASITIYDVTQIILPKLRELTGPPNVTIQLVLSATPGLLEADLLGFKLLNVTYNKDSITGQLAIENLDNEPFPSHNFLPNTFPGLF